MVAKRKALTALGSKKLSRSFRKGRAGTTSVHTHSLKFFGGKKTCSPNALPKGGLKNSPAWKLLVKRSDGKVPVAAKLRLGAPIKGGLPVDKWPVNVLVDTERAFWLPDDWGQGIKNTGTGGTYLGWISPEGKFEYHKNMSGRCGVEVNLGRTLTALDGFNGILRKVESKVPAGSDKKFLSKVLSASERKNVVPADAFHFCIVSARRANTPEGQNDIMLVEAHFRNVGVKPTWYVDEGSLEAYRSLGLTAIVGGKLTPARNLALDHARAKKKVCVQVSDDISMWEYFNIPQLHGAQSDFKKMNAAVADAEKAGEVFSVSPLGAAQFILAKMRSHSKRPQLGGVFPQANMAMGVCQEEFALQHFILGDFFVAEPRSACRFDTTMTLKEDYDFTAAHLDAHGAVMRCNRLILRVKHATNAGGAVSARDAAGAKERENIAILQRKWPGVFSMNGRRSNEVVMCWSRLQSGIADEGEHEADAGPTRKVNAKAASTKAKLAGRGKLAEFPAGATVRFVESPAARQASHIVKRCRRADGCTVEELLSRFTYRDAQGNQRRYAIQDLRYDLASARLKLSKAPAGGRDGSTAGKKTKRSTIKRHVK